MGPWTKDKMPVNDYSEYFGPTHTLQISVRTSTHTRRA